MLRDAKPGVRFDTPTVDQFCERSDNADRRKHQPLRAPWPRIERWAVRGHGECQATSCFSGKVTSNMAPPAVPFLAVTRPLWVTQIFWTSASPRPVPVGRVVKNG